MHSASKITHDGDDRMYCKAFMGCVVPRADSARDLMMIACWSPAARQVASMPSVYSVASQHLSYGTCCVQPA